MQIREATELDIPEILKVLKASLGETSSKKTESVWRYKHVDNPFGKSLVVVALVNGRIVGVRALMRWKWQLGEQVFSAFRAVDTATHPDHQGKGIFKKLTLRAIQIAKEEGGDFIFNTPNNQSLPGYLKMGWREVDKLRIRIVPANPSIWFKAKMNRSYMINIQSSKPEIAQLIMKYKNNKIKENKLFTLKSSEYLSWRYENNPLQKYEVYADKDFYLAGYIKEHKFFNELRITEHIFSDNIGAKKINYAIKELNKKLGGHIISSARSNRGLRITGNFGPVLTMRDINLNLKLNPKFSQLYNWSYSLGDLELF
jgi:GNAT superfamily N-acetyltransferase